MKSLKPIRAAFAAGLAWACLFGLSGCGEAATGPAATVNGVEISEETVTAYIQDFRTSSSLEDEEAWGEWLVSSDQTPQSVREDVIDHFASQELLKQAAQERGVEADAAEVDKSIESMKANYDSDEAWQEALAVAGATEESFREQAELVQLESALQASFEEPDGPTDEALLESAAAYDGAKRASRILFASDAEAEAQSARDALEWGGFDFDEAVENVEEAGAVAGGDLGWDVLSGFDPDMRAALAELEEGQVSDLVETAEGFCLIKCTDVFAVPEDGLSSVDEVPAEIADSLRDSLAATGQSTAYAEWYADFEARADIVINDMPENVPYNIDLSSFSAESGSDDPVPADPDAEAGAAPSSDVGVAPEDAESTAEPEAPANGEPEDGAAADAAPVAEEVAGGAPVAQEPEDETLADGELAGGERVDDAA